MANSAECKGNFAAYVKAILPPRTETARNWLSLLCLLMALLSAYVACFPSSYSC